MGVMQSPCSASRARLLLFCLLLALAAATPPGRAQIPGSAVVAPEDDRFLREAVEVGLAKIQVAQVASERAVRPHLRMMAARLGLEDTQATQALQVFAGRKGLALPAILTGTHQSVVDRLRTLTGEAFEDAYLEAIKSLQATGIALFEAALSDIRDPVLERLTEDILVGLQDQRAWVQAMEQTALAAQAG